MQISIFYMAQMLLKVLILIFLLQQIFLYLINWHKSCMHILKYILKEDTIK